MYIMERNRADAHAHIPRERTLPFDGPLGQSDLPFPFRVPNTKVAVSNKSDQHKQNPNIQDIQPR